MPASNGLIPAPGQGLRMPRSVFKRSVPGGMSGNYGRIYPVFMKYQEAGSSVSMDPSTLIRGATPIAPVMGNARMELHAFSVPWRIIWNYTKQFFGENDTSAWTQTNEYEKPQIRLRIGDVGVVPAGLFDGSVLLSDLTSDNSTFNAQYISYTTVDFVKIGDCDSNYLPSGIIDDGDYVYVLNCANSDFYGSNKLADYLGLHPIPKDSDQATLKAFYDAYVAAVDLDGEFSISVDALPFRAFFSIVNYYYRDQNYQAPYLFTKDNGVTRLSSIELNGSPISNGLKMPYDFMDYRFVGVFKAANNTTSLVEGSAFCPPASRFKDPFSTIVPEPLKGDQYDLLSLAGLAPVNGVGTALHTSGDNIRFGNGTSRYAIGNACFEVSGGSLGWTDDGTSYPRSFDVDSSNLFADLANTSKITLEKFRDFVVLNQWNEKAVKGTRYAEILNEFYGTPVNPALLDEPKFLGGVSIPITSWQVTQTAPNSDGSGVGDLSAFTHTKDTSSLFTETFQEPSILMVLAVARVEHTFAQQVDPHWFRKDKFDEHYALFDGLGYQPLDKRIPYLPFGVIKDNGGYTDEDSTLGFQESFWEERYQLGNVSGVLNASNYLSLDYWMYNELPTEKPVSGPEYLSAYRDADIVDRTLQLGSEASRYAQQFIVDFSWNYVEAKVISSRMDPGLTRI